MRHLRAFLNGLCECRSDFTTHYPDDGLLLAYDRGRNIARTFLRLDTQ